MDHSYFKDKLSAYFDGALEAQERELIRRHLEDCSECQRLLDEISLLSSAIEKHSGLAGDEYFEQLAKKIDSRIAQPKEKVVDVRQFRWQSVIWKFSAAAASILLVGTIGYYQWFQDEELPQRMLESAKPPSVADRVVMDSVSDINAEEDDGRMKSDIGGSGIISESELPSAIAKNETGSREEVRNEPKSQAIVTDSKRRDNTSERQLNVTDSLRSANAAEPAPAQPAESKEVAGKLKIGQVGGDEVAVLQEDLSATLPDDSDGLSSEFAQTEKLNLEELRMKNMSLQSQVSQDKAGYYSMDNFKEKKPEKSNLKSFAEAKEPDSIYQQLAISWFQISQLSKDKEEKNQAVQYLNWYKSNFPSDSALANQYLKEITQ